MGWEPDFVTDGDPVTLLQVNTAFNDAKSWIDAIGSTGNRRGTFGRRHAAAILRSPLTAQWEEGDGSHNYNISVFGDSLTYDGWNGNFASDAFANIGTGDRTMIGHESATGGYAGGPARVLFGATRIGPDRDGVGTIVVLGNVHIESMFPGESDTLEAMICVQYQMNGEATWYTCPTSERFVSFGDHSVGFAGEKMLFDVPIMTTITEDEIDLFYDPDVDGVTGVRLMVSLVNPAADSLITLERWNLSVLPVLCTFEAQ